nr:MAG TPA: hypothetical protein [Caudoviricetes sp.]
MLRFTPTTSQNSIRRERNRRELLCFTPFGRECSQLLTKNFATSRNRPGLFNSIVNMNSTILSGPDPHCGFDFTHIIYI